MFVSIKGSSHARFHRALRGGNLRVIRIAARELSTVGLADALAICLLMSQHADDEPYERAAARWLARLVTDRPDVELPDLKTALLALEALPYNPAAARHTLAEICDRHRLPTVVGLLR